MGAPENNQVLVEGSVAASPALAAEQQGFVPWYVGSPQAPDSGWQRLRGLVQKDELNRYPEETMNIINASFSAAIIGFVYGGVPGFHYARKQYIQRSQAEIFYNRLDAVQSVHRAATRGFIRYGWRWGWRVAAFVTIFNTVQTALSVYREESALSHFGAAGAVTGGLFRMNLGLRGLVGGSIIGAVLGVPAGGLLMAMQKLVGETVQERRKRERREEYERKLAEWRSRLDITGKVVEKMDYVIQEGGTERDTERIQELLVLPQNPGVLEDGD
uniref:Complex I assembly factor TIMMDC1, mitochondrial n=1 Tax=Sphenodon punctatus TaxID=8508 RepID=A0A8D0GZZ9_SPHPU